MGETIDWKAELRKYEREFDGLPPEPTPQEVRAQRLAAIAQKEREERDGAAFAAWMRLMLVVSLAAAIRLWPYPRACGMGLVFYLVAVAAIVIGGVWVAMYAWRYRLGRTHTLAFLMTLWGLGLVASETLPRTGYARPSAATPAQWGCSAARH
jgi:hypothetical protein